MHIKHLNVILIQNIYILVKLSYKSIRRGELHEIIDTITILSNEILFGPVSVGTYIKSVLMSKRIVWLM